MLSDKTKKAENIVSIVELKGHWFPLFPEDRQKKKNGNNCYTQYPTVAEKYIGKFLHLTRSDSIHLRILVNILWKVFLE